MMARRLCFGVFALALVGGGSIHAARAFHIAKKISLPGNTGWDYLFADTLGHRLYISRRTSVQVVDTRSDRLIATIDGFVSNHGIAIDTTDHRGFISDGRGNAVTIFDLKTLKTIGAPVAVGKDPDCIIFDAATGRVFAFDGKSNDATVIDGRTGAVVGTVPLPGRPEFAVADTRGHIYDNIEDKNEIASIDARTLKVDNTWSIAPGNSPSGIAMDRKNRRVFSVCDNQTMVVSDPDAGKVVATYPIGNGADAASFDPATSEVFAPAGDDGTVTVFHEITPDTYQVVGTEPTQSGARTISLDERAHRLYTVAATMEPNPDPTATGKSKMRVVDGSFVVLVLEPDGK